MEEAPLPGSGAPEGYQNYYLHDNENGTVDALLKLPENVREPADMFNMELMTASPNLKHVVIATKAALTTGMPNETEAENLYEWTADSFEPISIYPDGTPQQAKEARTGSGFDGNPSISDDGLRVVWTEHENLYMRQNIGTIQAKTVIIGEKATFQIQSSDGTLVYYTQGDPRMADLFQFNVETNKSILVATAVAGVVGVSENGSYVYYVNAGEHLFVWHEGDVHMVATLSGGDEQSGILGSPELGVAGDWSGRLAYRTARVSPDGKRLVFMSENSLTGYDNTLSTGSSCVNVEQRPGSARCEEVFLYDAASEHLTCVSCNPTGARPTGWSGIPGGTQYDGIAETLYDSRVLSDNGRRVFFNSVDAIVPGDTNGVGDVYEWEEKGEGNCASEGGCVSLISSGKGSAESLFLDASVNGNDVFFLTHDKLAGADLDNVADVYDAHVCSASASCFPVAPVVPPPCGTGDGCRPSPSPQLSVFGAPASATFSGAGNVVASSPVTVGVKKAKHKVVKKRKRKRKGKAGRVVRNANGSRGTKRSSAGKGR